MSKKQKARPVHGPAVQPATGQVGSHQQLQLALNLLRRGDDQHGLSMLMWLAQQPQTSLQACMALAQWHLARGNSQEALTWAQRGATDADVVTANVHVALVLSRCLRQVGRATQAVVLCQQALVAHPNAVELRMALALAHRDAGDLHAAEQTYVQALTLAPGHPDLSHNLGNLRQQRGDFDGARQAYLEALAAAPAHAPALLELAHLAQRAAQPEVALELVQRALSTAPQLTRGWRLLAGLCQSAAQWQKAREAWETVLSQDAREAADWQSLGGAAWGMGDAVAALSAYGEALMRAPDSAQAHHGQALAYRVLGRLADAMSAIQRAMACGPSGVLAAECLYLSTALQLEMGEVSAAVEPIERLAALAKHPVEEATVLELRAALASSQGDMAACLAWRKQALAALPDRFSTAQSLCAAAQYLDSVDGDEQARITVQAMLPFAPRQDAVCLPQQPVPKPTVRVGFVSADLRRHSCAFFLEPLWQGLNQACVHPFVYSASQQHDPVTDRLKSLVPDWRDVAHLDAAGLRDVIRADGIDILIDLSGHTEGSRLDALALRCAPIQMTWLGYLSTTGLPSMDLRLSDAAVNPPEHDPQHTERVLRMERPYVVYRPDPTAPDVVDPPALSSQVITFGSFNAIQKISPACVALWSSLLMQVPNSRLLLKARPLADASVRERLVGAFMAHGVSPERMVMLPHVPEDKHHLAAYGQVDIALDTWPYHGVTTTCEALWMGVPVLSRWGNAAVSRQSLTLLPAVGLGHLALADEAAWRAAGVALSADLGSLKTLRHGLRDRMSQSPLMDVRGFARSFEGAMHAAWQGWCARG